MRLLLLAGTREARQISMALARQKAGGLVTAVARADRRPQPYGAPLRIGEFDGAEGLSEYIERENITSVLDAMDPFSADFSHVAADVADAKGLDYLQFLRPAWRPEDGDNWMFTNTLSEVAGHVPDKATVLVATGERSLPEMTQLTTQTIYARLFYSARATFPFEKGGYLSGNPPYSVDGEIGLLERLGVNWVVARNTGGPDGRPLVEACRELRLPMAMLRRPLQPEVPRVETISAAVTWARRRM